MARRGNEELDRIATIAGFGAVALLAIPLALGLVWICLRLLFRLLPVRS